MNFLFALKEFLALLFSALFVYLLGTFIEGHVDITQWSQTARGCAVLWFIVVLSGLTIINFYYYQND